MVATPAMLPRNNPPKRAGGDSYEEFHPYGTTAWSSTAGVTVSLKRYKFTGMERDEETGLQCHGVRYYAAWLGRWTSADPIGLGDGVNRFCYCHGGVVAHADASGLGPALIPFILSDSGRGAPTPLDPLEVLARADGALAARLDTIHREIIQLEDSRVRGAPTDPFDLEHYLSAGGSNVPVRMRGQEADGYVDAGLAKRGGDGFWHTTGFDRAVEGGLITSEDDQSRFFALRQQEREWGNQTDTALDLLGKWLAILSLGGGGVASLAAKAPPATAATLAAARGFTRSLGMVGDWVNTGEHMSFRAAKFQKAVTGIEAGASYLQHGVKYDGVWASGVLVDAKASMKGLIDPGTGTFKEWFKGGGGIVDQAERQIGAADGAKVQWVFEDEATLGAVKQLLEMELAPDAWNTLSLSLHQ